MREKDKIDLVQSSPEFCRIHGVSQGARQASRLVESCGFHMPLRLQRHGALSTITQLSRMQYMCITHQQSAEPGTRLCMYYIREGQRQRRNEAGEWQFCRSRLSLSSLERHTSDVAGLTHGAITCHSHALCVSSYLPPQQAFAICVLCVAIRA